MVTASFTCARLFQDWPWRSWKLASLTILISGISSEIQSLKTQWTKWNWKVFVLVVKNFLDNNKAINYTELVNNMLTAFRNLGCNMSVKMHYLFSHIDPVSWEPGFNEWWGGGEIPTGPERDGDQVSGSLGCSHDGWLLLESEERPPCHWAFQVFEETEVQALNFEQWWSNMQFTCTHLYRWPPFSLQ